MTKTPDYQEDLASIRHAMERSVKFISLSGVSGILSGLYALAGAAAAAYMLQLSRANGEPVPVIQLLGHFSPQNKAGKSRHR